jgi:hypothetical protein
MVAKFQQDLAVEIEEYFDVCGATLQEIKQKNEN